MLDLIVTISSQTYFIPIIPLIVFIHYRRKTFFWTKYIITKEGVNNRILKLKWENIENFKVFFEKSLIPNGKQGISRKAVFPPMICMGKIKKGGLFRQDKKHCVVVPLTQRNLALIGEYYKGDNAEIKEIIEKYTGCTDQDGIEWQKFWE